MPVWLIDIVTSEFLWGIVVGLIVAMAGAYVQSKLNYERMLFQQKIDIRNFARDIIKNIMKISEDMGEAKRRSNLIHHDFLALLDVEVQLFGRTREHLIRLDGNTREEFRKYITNCALRRTDISIHLGQLDKSMQRSRDLLAQDNIDASKQAEIEGAKHLENAHKAMDELIATSKTGEGLLQKLADR